jgi:hypothetical protein
MQEPLAAFYIFGIAIVSLVVVAGAIILILRMFPGYQKAVAAGSEEQERRAQMHAQIDAAYAQAGLRAQKRLGGITRVDGVHAGMPYTHAAYPPSRGSPASAEVAVLSPVRGDFIVTAGRASEATTVDAATDNQFSVSGISGEFVKAVFADKRNRDVVEALLKMGFDRVELDGTELTAIKLQARYLLDPAVVTAAVEQLAGFQGAGIAPYVGITHQRVSQFIGVCVIVAVALGLLFNSSGYQLVGGWWGAATDAWQVIVIAGAAFIAVAVTSLRGRTRELLLVIFMCLPALVVAGWSVAVLANQHFDASPLATHDAKLLRNHKKSGLRSSECRLEVESWRGGMEYVRVIVPKGVYDKAVRDKVAAIGTHAGWLGFEWIYSVDGVIVSNWEPC